MKSQSVQRPHRVPAAELHALVDVLAAGEALLVHPHRRHQVGDEQHVDDEAGAVLGAGSPSCRSARRTPRRARRSPSRCPAPTTISTSFMTGTGEKKCRPSTRCGRRGRTRPARRSGSTRCSRRGSRRRAARRRARGRCPALIFSSSTIASTTSSASPSASRSVDHSIARQQLGGLVLGELAALDRARDRALDARARVLERRALGLVERARPRRPARRTPRCPSP